MSKAKRIGKVLRKMIMQLVKTKRKDYTIEQFKQIEIEAANITDDEFTGLAEEFIGLNSRQRNRVTCDFMIIHIPHMGADCSNCEAKKSCEARE